uniref:Uncharacterized protein n=1 Tax=Avena sativa TaxID=4498 RepID=A0ACD5Z6R7_AVESA
MSGSSSVIAGSSNPPAITELDASQGLPPSILLDARAYFADRKNSTTATLDTGKAGRGIQVSICFAAPPALSYVCIHCPGHTDADFSDKPRVVRSEKQFLLLKLSLWGARFEEQVAEYYMYQAIRGGKPKLFQIPDLGPRFRRFLTLDHFGIYRCDDDEFILAGLAYTGGYRLHSYSSASKVWTARPADLEVEDRLTSERMPVATHKAIPLGGSLLGWVDLWKGILVCDVLCRDPQIAIGFIPLPLTGNTYDHICPWVIRDVACTDDGSLKFIEIEHLFSEPPPAVVAAPPDVMYDEDYFISLRDDPEPEPPKFVDWKATVWNRLVSDNCWRRGVVVHGNDMQVEELVGCTVIAVSTARNLLPSFPTLSIRGGDVVHMSSSGRLELGNGKTQMISIDMSSSTLKALAPCPPLEADDEFPYFPCVLSNYLGNHPALPQDTTQASNSGNLNQE